MADYPQVDPYFIEERISGTSFLTNYRAVFEDGSDNRNFVITEFNPTFMVRRHEDGNTIEPVERFLIEFETALERFTKMSEAFSELNEPHIASIENVLKVNNTVYVVRELDSRNRSLDGGLGTEKMDFNDAYQLLRPLTQNLATAWKAGLLFQFDLTTIRVTPYQQLLLVAMFDWETDHTKTIKQLGYLFYRLVTGIVFNPSSPDYERFSLPPRLGAAMKDILTGEPAYGSIDDFNKQMRAIMDIEGRKIVETHSEVEEEGESKPIKKPIAFALIGAAAVFVVGAIVVPLVWLVLYVQSFEIGEIEHRVPFHVTAAEAATTPFVRLHSGYAITDPRDATVMLNGSFLLNAGMVYHRSFQATNGLSSRMATGGSTNLVISDVRPAFLTAHGGYIYFSDGLANYSIRRVRPDGTGLETVSENMASFLTVDGNTLFYTNHSNRDFLYAMDLGSLQSTAFLQKPVYEPVILGRYLFFVNGSSNFRIYSISLDNPSAAAVRMNDANTDNLRVSGTTLYYRNIDNGTIHLVNALGEETVLEIPIPVESFDILPSLLAPTIFTIIEEGTNELWFYDRHQLISSGIFASYVSIINSSLAYAIDFNDSNTIREVPMP
ncbi:MAG: DUF5050 domain-containing protein [Turicibacter sp.]|nr:DUF5050 domain-containing protein [Turicibacter sp.]